ncbi:MAG: hypothetical protein ACOC41_00135 [Chitinivibrionales bacterium]
MDIGYYYRKPHVRSRIIDFLGGSTPDNATAMFISEGMQPCETGYEVHSPRALDSLLSRGGEVYRSLWDNRFFLIHLDIEYVNFDFPAEPYLDPIRAFGLQQPAVRSIQKILLSSGISPLHILTGRGHHFIWKIDTRSPAFFRLESIGHVPSHLKKTYARPHPPDDEPVGGQLSRAFSGVGLLMEFFAHRILDDARRETAIPLEVTAVNTGERMRGCEIVSLDITEYGDPLYTRSIRVPYSLYLKPWHHYGVITQKTAPHIPVMFLIPQHECTVEEGIRIMRDMDGVADLAQVGGTHIPEFSDEMLTLVEQYMHSDVRRFHQYFYAQDYHPPERWAQTYDRFSYDSLPDFVSGVLSNPNDSLLTPTGIRNVVRTLMAQQWHPHHITGLIQSKYERDFGWGNQWYVYDASMRAEFYTRLFAGLLLCGRDNLDGFSGRKTAAGDRTIDTIREKLKSLAAGGVI